MSASYCWVVQGTRGGGKGAFGCHMVTQYIESNRRIATNFDLFLEHIPAKNQHSDITRIPDKPNAQHLYALGQAYDFDRNDPSSFDPSKNGLMLIDEISLFLSSKKNPEYEELNAFFMLSRKMGWNIIFICQNKEQARDEFFKSLCDKLVICRANGLQRIPYLGRLLELVGLSAMMPDNHTAYILSGRSELDPVEKEIPYNWRPYRLAYNTYQMFTDQKDYLNGKLVDMRTLYTYLPANYLNGQKFITNLNDRLNSLKTAYSKKGRGMALKQTGISTGMKLKIGLMVAGLAVYLYISNPLDNDFINKAIGASEPEQIEQPASVPIEQPIQQAQHPEPPPATHQTQQQKSDFIQQLFTEYTATLSALIQGNGLGVNAVIDFYQGNTLVQRLTTQEFHYHGYAVIPSGDTAVFVQSPNFKKRVSSDGVVIQKEPDNTEIASKLVDSVSLFTE